MATTPRKTAAGSRKPRSASRAASRPATRAVEPVEEYDEPDVTEAEAQEAEANDQYVVGSLCEEEVRIIPPGAWKQSWRRLLMVGRIDEFAEIVLHPDDYELYENLDPTNDQFGDFVNDAAERGGESLGKSRGPAPSSRRTRRR